MKLKFSRQIFEYSNIKFHENPSSGNAVVPYGRTDGQTDMTKLIVTTLNFANAPKKCAFCGRDFNSFCTTVTEISDYFPTQNCTP